MNPPEHDPAATQMPGPPASSPPAGLNDRFMVPVVCIFLAAIIWCVFGQTLHHAFVNYDDERYVYENRIVQKGLTWEGFRWAFTHVAVGNWHPLTMLSHMLDCELYGLNSAGHHLTNVLLHSAAAILLFLVLRRMTGALWRSAFVAAVFAIHPLRVESVAWVAERKDVLSGVFFMLSLLAYVRYVERGEWRGESGGRGEGGGDRRSEIGDQKAEVRSPWSVVRGLPPIFHLPSSIFYLLSLSCFALGLMSKPMLVTVPFVLLLLDYWPLGRFTLHASRFTMSPPVCCLRSFPSWRWQPHLVRSRFLPSRRRSNRSNGCLCPCASAMRLWPVWPIWARCSGRHGWRFYTRSRPEMSASPPPCFRWFCWPAFPRGSWSVDAASLICVTGWMWYLIMLLPVIGIIQVGSQARADRYTYLPQIGLYLLLTWAAADLCAGWRHRRALLGVGAAAMLAALMVSARTQAAYWRNTETLWTHTLACTTGNAVAHNNLGEALLKMGRADEATVQFQAALQIRPNSAQAHNNLGSILAQKNEADEAIAHFEKALQFQPRNWQAQGNLASVLFYQKGRADEAMAHCQQALEIRPDLAQAHTILGHILLQRGRDAEALAHYQKVLQTEPDSPIVLNNIGFILATSPDASLRNGTQAVQYAKRACDITNDSVPPFVRDLAAAYAEAGRYDEAIAAAERAGALASAGGQLEVLEETRKELDLYLAHQPYHRPPAGSAVR